MTPPRRDDDPRAFYRRSIKASVVMGLLGALVVAVRLDPAIAGRYLLYLGWMLGNLMLLDLSWGEFLRRRRPSVLVPLFALDALWVLALLGLVAWTGLKGAEKFFPFLLGFNTPFLVMFLKSLGRALTQGRENCVFIEEKPPESGATPPGGNDH